MNHLLQSQLQSYASSGLYPLHMPGHKRRVVPAPGLPAGWDMTEVPGVDDLHDADGILADAMARTAALWGAKRTWYLVNGSTCGILAAIRAAVVSSGRTAVICARNCHKSVYHAIELNRLTAHWLVPPVDPAFGIYGSITPAMVADALRACPDAAAVILTSPTYEGVLSDLAAIAALLIAFIVSAFTTTADSRNLFFALFFCIIAIPILAWLFILCYGRMKGRHTMAEFFPDSNINSPIVPEHKESQGLTEEEITQAMENSRK